MKTPPGHDFRISQGTRIALITIALLLLLALCQPAVAARDVRVGLQDIRPAIYTDAAGEPAGLFVDLIEDIAAEEGWNLIWVNGTFQENLERLAADRIDLLMPVIDTPEREEIFDFSQETVGASWTQVYAPPGAGIQTIQDLDRKRVAVMRGDVNGIVFRDNAVKFNISPTYLEADDLDEVFRQVTSGSADASVAGRLAGRYYEQQNTIAATPVMFSPSHLGFAVLKGRNADLLQAIDRYLAQGKSDPSSYYSLVIQKYFSKNAGWEIPPYLIWGLIITCGLVGLLVVMSVVLRREVWRKTTELSRQNEDLQSEVASRMRAEAELVRKNEELQVAYAQLTATEGELRAKYQDLGKSDLALLQARKKLNLLHTLTVQEIQSGVFSLAGFIELAKEAGCSDKATTYLEKGRTILHSFESTLSFAKDYQDMGISPPRWQNVNYVIINAISHLDFSTISRTVELDGLEIYADPLLERVFFNLMDNVKRHSGGATRVALHYQEIQDSITILVEDNGTGISATEKEKIFERGYARKGGSGLFLSREILSITGITIRESGMHGTGARFEITVPKEQYRFVPPEPDRRNGDNPPKHPDGSIA
jgi:ABC-type amino acid transport substrate-binding protein